MGNKLKSDFGWIFRRVAIHLSILVLLLTAFYFITNSLYLFVGVSSVIFGLYIAIIFAHIKLDLVSFHSDRVIFRDYFFKGKAAIALSDIEFVEITSNEVRFIGLGANTISTKGMSYKNLVIFRDEISTQAIEHGLRVKK